MKAIVKTGEIKGVECININKPLLGAKDVLVKIKAAAICGTDVDYYEWGNVAKSFASKRKIQFPFVLGHECSGEIIEIGKDVVSRKIGDRIAIEPHIPCQNCYMCRSNNKHNCMNMKVFGIDTNGGFAEYVAVSEDAVFVLPDDFSYIQGALLEPAGVAMHAVNESHITGKDIVVINGCGAIGLFLIILLKCSGVKNIIAVGGSLDKLAMAEKLGARAVNYHKRDYPEKIKKYTKEHEGADIVFEASGSVNAYPLVFDIVRKEGCIITIGHPSEMVKIDIMNCVNRKGISIKGIYGRRIWDSWEQLINLINEKNIKLEEIVSNVFTLDECEEAFRNAKTVCGKTVFSMGN